MNSNLEAIIALSVVFLVFFILYYNTKESYSDKTIYVSGVSYGVSILVFIAIVILGIIILIEVLK
jgi:uncharacterized membrane protein YozB (DUF420 family)